LNRLHFPLRHEAEFDQILQVLRIFVSLLVLLVHEEVKRRVCELSIEENAQEVFGVLEGVSILTLAVECVNFELLDAAIKVLNVDLVGDLVELELLVSLDLAVELLLFSTLLFDLLLGRLFLLARTLGQN